LAEPTRRPSGYRQYEENVITRLQFIRRAKELGFTLNEIKELLSLRADSRTTCADVRNRANAKIADINQKIGAVAEHGLFYDFGGVRHLRLFLGRD
jgi:DNA-binding transcriptional MerR regulator